MPPPPQYHHGLVLSRPAKTFLKCINLYHHGINTATMRDDVNEMMQ